MSSATSTFSGRPSSVPSARRWVVATLVEWGLEATGWTAAQVVSELATNCTLHARSDFTIRLVLDSTCVRLEAEDSSPAPLQSRAYTLTSTTGRGLGIVDVLAVQWGVTSGTAGKTVWALLAVEAADLGPSDEDVDVHASPGGRRTSGTPRGTSVALAPSGAAA